MSFNPVIKGSYTLAAPQTVSVNASSSSSVSISFTPLGAGELYVYIALPSGVTATISIGGQSVSLANGGNQFLIPANTTIGNITINNSNSSAVSVVTWALFIEVA
jgi:hypothetical protein